MSSHNLSRILARVAGTFLFLCIAPSHGQGLSSGSRDAQERREIQEIREWMRSLSLRRASLVPEPERPRTCLGATRQDGLYLPFPRAWPEEGLAASADRVDDRGRICR